MALSRVILFKIPAPERQIYVQKVLDVLGSPHGLIIKLTTYRSKWIPSEIYDEPEKLENQLAWIVCINNIKNEKTGQSVTNYLPMREVKILHAERRDETLMLWLEMNNYLKCTDYQRFSQELANMGKPLPPSEKSFIMTNAKITCIDVISKENREMENEAWKATIDSISNMDAFRNSIFYRMYGLTDSDKVVTPVNVEVNGEPKQSFTLQVNKTYALNLHYYLPEKQFEFCPQTVKLSSQNEWVKFYGNAVINDRSDDITVNLKPSQVTDSHPFNNAIDVDIFPESSKLFGPKVTLPTVFKGERVTAKLKRNVLAIVSFIAFTILFCAGQLLQALYPTVNDITPTWMGMSISLIGVGLSTFAITLVPITISSWKRED